MAVGDLVVNLIARTDRFSRGMSSAKKSISSFTKAAYGIGSAVTAGIGVASTAIAGLAVSAIKLAADAEQTEVAFSTMLGSAELAKKTIEDLRKFTASTPFGEAEILSAAKSLVAFGSSADSVAGELRMLGDISSGVGVSIGDIAEIYGKARVQGRLFAEDINQLTGRGIPIYEALANVLGVSQDKIKGLVTEGKIGFPELEAAFQNMTAEGGKFFKMTESQSETLWGKWSTLKDNVTSALRDIGIAIMEEFDLGEASGNLTELVQQFKTEFLPGFKEGLNTLGEIGKPLVEAFHKVREAMSEAMEKLLELQFKVAQVREKLGIDKNANSLLNITYEQFKAEMDQRDALNRIKSRNGGGVEKISQAEAIKRFGSGSSKSSLSPEMQGVGEFIKKMQEERAAMPAETIVQKSEKTQQVRDSQVRSLQAKSQEAYDVLLANTRPGSGKDNAVAEQKKTNLKLDKVIEKLDKGNNQKRTEIEIKGF